MIVLLSAFAASLALLIALKLSSRLSLKVNLLARMSVSGPKAEASCPHLGLAQDPFSHESGPSEEHRCYLWMQRDRIDLTHQNEFCLTSAHRGCPWLAVRHPQAAVPLKRRLDGALPGVKDLAGRGLAIVKAWAPRVASEGRRLGRAGWLAFRLATVAMVHFLAAAIRTGLHNGVVAGGWAVSWTIRILSWLAARTALTFRRLVTAAASRRRPAPALAAIPDAATELPAAPSFGAFEEPAPVTAEEAIVGVMQHSDQPLMATGDGEAQRAEALLPWQALVKEGLAALDRDEEALAYHAFRLATEHSGADQQAWFWRAKTAESVDELVLCLERGLRIDPSNARMQAHLAYAQQRLERERQLQAAASASSTTVDQKIVRASIGFNSASGASSHWFAALGEGVRMLGGLASLALAFLWMTTALLPALLHVQIFLPSADQRWLGTLLPTLKSASLQGSLQLPLPGLDFDLASSLPFILGFFFLFTGRGLMDGDAWSRAGGLLAAAVGAWLCSTSVANPAAAHLGLSLCVGLALAAAAGRFESPGLAHHYG